MSFSSEAFVAGHDIRSDVSGGVYTFRGLEITIPDPKLVQGKTIDAGITVSLDANSVFELPSDLDPAPARGEVITDPQGAKHRIQNTNFIQGCWLCACERDS